MNCVIIIKYLIGLIVLAAAYAQESTQTTPVASIKKNESLVNVSYNQEIEKEIQNTKKTIEQTIPELLAPSSTTATEVQIEPPPIPDVVTKPLTQPPTEASRITTTESPVLLPVPHVTIATTSSPVQKTSTSSSAHSIINGNQPGCIKGNSIYCEQLEDAEINKMIKVIQHLNMTDTYFTENPKELAQRRNDPVEDALCHTVERYIYPQSAKNRENEWRYIVNNGRFTQAVRVEECTLVGSPCQLSPKFPVTYQSECRQKYIYHNLLGYDSVGKVVKDFYKLPSCCQCFVKPRK